MTFVDCPREQDLIDALTTGQWPDRCGDDLTRHVAACQGCRDLATIVSPLGDAWAETRADAHVPAPGMVWWRAQMRARQEAARAAARPITVVQGAAALAATAVLVAFLAAFGPWLSNALVSSREFLAIAVPDASLLASRWLLAGVVALLAIASLAVYLVVAED